MKSKIILTLGLFMWLGALRGQTPVYYQGNQTNPLVLQAWPAPPTGPAFASFGTNLVYIGSPVTNTPNASGFWSNSIWPATYKVSIPAYGSSAFFYAVIPNTTNYASLSLYATNVAVAGGVQSGAEVIANMLGYTPVANTYSGISTALGFLPATNGGSVAYSQLPFVPPTNTFAGLTNALGYLPATNPAILLTTNLQFIVPGNLTNTLNITNSVIQNVQ